MCPVINVRGATEHETPRGQVHLPGLILLMISGLPLICSLPHSDDQFLGASQI